MSAPTHSVPMPMPSSSGRAAQVRLQWWALLLPLAAFAALLVLPLAGPGQDDGARGDQKPVSQMLDRVQQALTGG